MRASDSAGCAEPLPGPGPAGEERQITTDAADQCCPAIYGDRIVWTDYRNREVDIYLLHWPHCVRP